MATQIAVRHLRQYSLKSSMDSAADKEERKREYNRLAQREFRRRRKEHLKSLEQAQKDQSSEQSEEIERLRYQNDELRRENEALRSQIYGSSSSTNGFMPNPINIPLSNDGRSYSLSPSISGTSISGAGSPPSTLSSDIVPMAALSLTSSSMLPPSMQAYADPSALSSHQPYSMVHPSGLHQNAQSSPESSGLRSPQSAVGRQPSFHPLDLNVSQPPQPTDAHPSFYVPGATRRSSSSGGAGGAQQSSTSVTPYDRAKARADLHALFAPLISDPSIASLPSHHLATLRTLGPHLPPALQPTKAQLATPHYHGIDLLASPSLRDRLLTVTPDVARRFVAEIGILGSGGEREEEDVGQLVIWGEEPLDEMAWEFSRAVMERWGWLLGRWWVVRANFWRKERGAALLPDW